MSYHFVPNAERSGGSNVGDTYLFTCFNASVENDYKSGCSYERVSEEGTPCFNFDSGSLACIVPGDYKVKWVYTSCGHNTNSPDDPSPNLTRGPYGGEKLVNGGTYTLDTSHNISCDSFMVQEDYSQPAFMSSSTVITFEKV